MNIPRLSFGSTFTATRDAIDILPPNKKKLFTDAQGRRIHFTVEDGYPNDTYTIGVKSGGLEVLCQRWDPVTNQEERSAFAPLYPGLDLPALTFRNKIIEFIDRSYRSLLDKQN